MISRLVATQFHGFTGSGRTSPARCGCEDEAGNPAGDFVVKLSGAMERGSTAHLCELAASQVAMHFGIAVPEPAIVVLEDGFVQLVANAQQRLNPDAAERTRRSAGVNFGSRHLTGIAIWPVDRHIPQAQWQAATDIFAFDALIDNPDRRYGNPNLFTRGNELIVFDHESAFSFLLAILQPPEAWKLTGTPYLDHHVFFRRLKSQKIDLTGFEETLTRLDDNAVADFAAAVPPEWNNRDWPRIADHLRAIGAHATEFAEAVRRKLA